MSSLLITNADIVNEGRRFEADVLIEDGRIAAIGGDLQARPADRVIDAAGRLLIPGMIDDQVHFREPGLTTRRTSPASRGRRWPAASPASWRCRTATRRP
jgi:dihydroorotase